MSIGEKGLCDTRIIIFFFRFSDTLAFSIKMLDIKWCLVTGIQARREEPKLLLHVNGEHYWACSRAMLTIIITVDRQNSKLVYS